MKQVYDDEPARSIIEKTQIPDGVYVNVNLTGDYGKSTERKGLDIALQHLETSQGNPIVLFSFESPYNLFLDRKFMKIMSNQNAHFLRAPFSLQEIPDYLSMPTFRNEALEIVSTAEESSDLLRVLRHNYRYRPEENINRARKELGLSGNDDYIKKLLEAADPLVTRYSGKITGVFCDIEGTLIKDGKVDYSVLEKLFEYSREHPITLWTGADVQQIVSDFGNDLERAIKSHAKSKGMVTNLHLRTPILSKHTFTGSQPEIVIDDLALEEFEKQFGMKPKTYIRSN